MNRLQKILSFSMLLVAAFSLASCSGCQSNKLERNIEVTQSAEITNSYIPDLDSTGFAASISAVTVNPATWNYIGKKPAVIEFYATWCKYCKEQHPIMEEIAKKYKKSINFYRIDIDKEPTLANMFNVTAVPTIVYISKDGALNSVMGMQPRDSVMNDITLYVINE